MLRWRGVRGREEVWGGAGGFDMFTPLLVRALCATEPSLLIWYPSYH